MNAVPGAVAKGALLCGVVAMSVGGPLAIAQSASAAPGDVVEVSADGVTYGPTFPGSLFGAIRLVPGSSDTTTLWVRNPTSATAYLRVVLTEVVADDQDYWGALSVRTTVLGQVASMPMPSPSTCTVLATAVPMGAGQALPVIFALSLADLNGRQGQNGRADFAIGVTLSEVAYPTDCSTPAVVVPATPTTRSATGSSLVVPVAGSTAEEPAVGGRIDLNFVVLLIGSAIGLGAGWLIPLALTRRNAGRPSPSPIATSALQGGTP